MNDKVSLSKRNSQSLLQRKELIVCHPLLQHGRRHSILKWFILFEVVRFGFTVIYSIWLDAFIGKVPHYVKLPRLPERNVSLKYRVRLNSVIQK